MNKHGFFYLLAIIIGGWLLWRFLRTSAADNEAIEGGDSGDQWGEPDRIIDNPMPSSSSRLTEGSSWEAGGAIITVVNGVPTHTGFAVPSPNLGADYTLVPAP